jgi:hypothetical protein
MHQYKHAEKTTSMLVEQALDLKAQNISLTPINTAFFKKLFVLHLLEHSAMKIVSFLLFIASVLLPVCFAASM